MKNPMEDLNGVDQAAKVFAVEQGWGIYEYRNPEDKSVTWSAFVRGRNEPHEGKGPSLAAAVRALAMRLNTPGWKEVFPEAVPPPKAEEKAPDKTGPCLSWRTRGGVWSLMEIGIGDAMKLSNHMRPPTAQELEVSDDDLLKIRELIDAALTHRGKKPDWLAGEGMSTAAAERDLFRKELMKRARDMERPGSIHPLPPINEVISREKWAEHIAEALTPPHGTTVTFEIESLKDAILQSLNTGIAIEDEPEPSEEEIEARIERRAEHIADRIMGGRDRHLQVTEPGNIEHLFERYHFASLQHRISNALKDGLPIPESKDEPKPNRITPPFRGFTPAELAKVAERVAQDVVGEHSCFVSRPDGSVAFGRSSNTSVRTKDELAMMIEKSLHTALALHPALAHG